MQVVGKNCAICSKKILTINEGLFCDRCQGCYHARCAADEQCSDCDGELKRPDRKPADWKRGAFSSDSSKGHQTSTILPLIVSFGLLLGTVAWWMTGQFEPLIGFSPIPFLIVFALISFALFISLVRR